MLQKSLIRLLATAALAAAWVSTPVYGNPALAARSLKICTNSAADGLLVNGGSCSNKVVESAFFASGACTIGPGAGYR